MVQDFRESTDIILLDIVQYRQLQSVQVMDLRIGSRNLYNL